MHENKKCILCPNFSKDEQNLLLERYEESKKKISDEDALKLKNNANNANNATVNATANDNLVEDDESIWADIDSLNSSNDSNSPNSLNDPNSPNSPNANANANANANPNQQSTLRRTAPEFVPRNNINNLISNANNNFDQGSNLEMELKSEIVRKWIERRQAIPIGFDARLSTDEFIRMFFVEVSRKLFEMSDALYLYPSDTPEKRLTSLRNLIKLLNDDENFGIR
jgi:hypothetical protein